jgi:GH25 family lysozyme M1 (1,4-beta-N-acetylmuramidase)
MEQDLADPTTPDFVWIPRYRSGSLNNGTIDVEAKLPEYPCDMWQYSSGAYFPGIKGKVDVNTLYDLEGNPLSGKDYFSFDWLVAGAEAG